MPQMWETFTHLKAEGKLFDGWNDEKRMRVAHGLEDEINNPEPHYNKFRDASHAYSARVRECKIQNR